MNMRSFFPSPAFEVADPVKPWIETVPPEVKGYVDMRGLAGKKVEEIALAAIQGHQEASKMLSYPQNEIVRVPKELTDPAMKNVWQRLGAPNAADGYDFTTVKHADGKEIAADVVTAFRNTAFEHSLPKPMAVEMLKAHVKLLDGQAAASLADRTAALQASQKALKTSWGASFDANMVVAKNAAATLGLKPETVAALENNVQYSEIMEMFRNIGMKIGEGRFVTPNTPGQTTAMTKEEASAQIEELKSDPDWKTRYLNGGRKEARQLEDLIRIQKGIVD